MKIILSLVAAFSVDVFGLLHLVWPMRLPQAAERCPFSWQSLDCEYQQALRMISTSPNDA